jgi:AcrR family transcriptional regulator
MTPTTRDATQATTPGGHARLPARERRALILSAASEVFAEQGFDTATVREIARRSSMTTPILYRHFESKAALHRSVVEGAGASLISTWASTPPVGSTEEVFRQATAPFFEWIESHRAAWSILFVDQPTDPVARATLGAIRASADEAMVRLVALLPITTAEGVSAEVFHRALARQIAGAGNALAAWWWEHQDVPASTVTAMNHALVWDGLSALTDG